MFKKIFTETLDSEFWTSVIMELAGCPLPSLENPESHNEIEEQPITFAVHMVSETADTETSEI